MTKPHWKWLCIGVIAGIYTWSFFLPAMPKWFGPGGENWTGWDLFLIGLRTPLMWCWWPNLLLLVGLLMLLIRRNRTALILGGLATIGACIWLEDYRNMYMGYYLWLTSMLLLTIAACLACFHDRKGTPKGPADPLPPALFDPSLSALFNKTQLKSSIPTEVHPGPPPDNQPCRLLQPPP